MAENTPSVKPVARQADPAEATATSSNSGGPDAAVARAGNADVSPPLVGLGKKPTPPRNPATAPAATSASLTPPAPQPTVKCPKCGTAVREVARFCQRCHNTMRFDCPACGNKQRAGGKCEKCGVDFIKYVGAVVAAKQAEADALQEKFEQRSAFMKNLVAVPFTGGLSLIRQLFVGRNRKS
ncbi:MAG: zinc-ribbon domain-containing protein [Candidatus Acidiferrales bacterium]